MSEPIKTHFVITLWFQYCCCPDFGITPTHIGEKECDAASSNFSKLPPAPWQNAKMLKKTKDQQTTSYCLEMTGNSDLKNSPIQLAVIHQWTQQLLVATRKKKPKK